MSFSNQIPMAALMQQMAQKNTNTTPIDRQRLMNSIGGFDQQKWQTLIAQARKQGISEADIESGLKFLLGK